MSGIDRVSQRSSSALVEEGYRAAQRATTLAGVLSSVGAAAIWTVAALVALGELGLNLGPLIAGAGIAGIALGFGAQTLVRDFLSGLFMLIEDQYGVGDIVDVGEASGVVERVTLRSTRLRDVDGTVWHVPNGEIKRVGNKSQDWARALLDVLVTYDSDIALAQAEVARVAAELVQDPAYADLVLGEPEVWGVERVGPEGLAIRLVVKTKPAEQWTIARALRARIKEAFDAAGIQVPNTQRVLLRQDSTFGVGGPTAPPPAPS